MQSTRRVAFEVCVETPHGIMACEGYADRIELCCALDLGGLTPSYGLMRQAKESGIETHVLIRPRAGSFEISEAELAVAMADIAAVKDLGLQGVVIGAIRDDALDLKILDKMVTAAKGLNLTLHRAFDLIPDRSAALEQAIDLGFHRILTSGGCATAIEGWEEIQKLCEQASGRIEIMAGAGISPANVATLRDKTGCDAIHASCTSSYPLPNAYQEKGFGRVSRRTDQDKLRQILAALRA
ncbi:MAG: copper homeostasis protein CutC [Pseudomonadota bacterium]